MVVQMLQVRPDGVGPLRCDAGHNPPFVIGLRFAFHHLDSAFGAMSNACSKSVTEEVTDEARLAVDDLQRSLGAVGNAFPASVAPVVIDGNDLSCAHGLMVPRRQHGRP